MKQIGLALMIAALSPVAFAAGSYTEVWNPPEARAAAPRRPGNLHRLATHRHASAHTVKFHARRAPASAPKLMVKQNRMQDAAPSTEPDMSDIPRQITPEGNVLRVTTHGATAQVTR
ncbi:hypothetical protein P3T18_006464 [Paraburkholderia sp. GAS199]|uniref:hypothetical protein n=1 Tax=Paraburkholderia sp. GAS199 TaxID=3035126 RepID=UPI003D203169